MLHREEKPREVEVNRKQYDISHNELQEKRENLESDRKQRLDELRILFPVTALLAPAILLVLAGFAVYSLDAEQFSYAILSYFFVFSGVFMLLAYHFRVHLTTTAYQYQSSYNQDHLCQYAALLKETNITPSVDEATRIISDEQQAEKDSLARSRRQGDYYFACGLAMLAGAFLVLYIAIAQKNLLTIYSSNPIHGVGVALFVVSYFAFSVVGYRSLRVLAQSSFESFPANLQFIDYLFSIVPWKVRVGDTKTVEVDLYREREDCEVVPPAYIEVELESAGVEFAADKKKRRLPICFQSLQVLWSCRFANTGKHTINITVNKVLPEEETEEVYFASFFTVQVVSPYRASLNAALTVTISALSALTAFFNILHPINF